MNLGVLKEKVKKFKRNLKVLQAVKKWEMLKKRYLISLTTSTSFYLPDEWQENRMLGHYKIPANLIDQFNAELGDANTKRAVGYYMKNHYCTVRKFINRFRFWNRPLWGTITMYKTGKLGGRLSLAPGDATHRWAALVWNAALSGYPVPDIPVELHAREIKIDLVKQIIKRFHVLYGNEFAVKAATEFLREMGGKVEVENLEKVSSKAENKDRFTVMYKDEYLLIERSCPHEFVRILRSDGFHDASPYLNNLMTLQEKNLSYWTEEIEKRLEKAETVSWDQKCCLLVKNEELKELLIRSELKSVFGSIQAITTSLIPCDAVFYLKGVPIAVFCKNGIVPQEVSLLYPKATIFAYELYGEESKVITVLELEQYKKLKNQRS